MMRGECTRLSRIAEKRTNRHRQRTMRAAFDVTRRLQRTIVGENRSRSFFRAGRLMALFASGRADTDGRTVARTYYTSRARPGGFRGGRAQRAHIMRVKPLARRNLAAAAAHNHTAHYSRRPVRDATARTRIAHP